MNRFNFLHLVIVIVMVVFSASCSNDDDVQEIIYHQNYVQGKLNNTVISINDINANISVEKSNYKFESTDGSNVPSVLDWEAKLIDVQDSVVTIYLHIDDLEKTNNVIYSPSSDEIQSRDQCYVTIKDGKTGKIVLYHPIHQSPVFARWNSFMVTTDGKTVKGNGVTFEYSGQQWPGIVGNLSGTFVSDDVSSKTITLNLDFKLY